jgi:hypothetical protein
MKISTLVLGFALLFMVGSCTEKNNIAPIPAQPALEVVVNKDRFGPVADTAIVEITTQIGWTIASDAKWAQPEQGNGVGASRVKIPLEANLGEGRSARIRVQSIGGLREKELVLTQTKLNASLTLSRDSLSPASQYITVTIVSGTGWSVRFNDQQSNPWLSFPGLSTTVMSGQGSATFKIEANANLEQARTARLVFSTDGVEVPRRIQQASGERITVINRLDVELGFQSNALPSFLSVAIGKRYSTPTKAGNYESAWDNADKIDLSAAWINGAPVLLSYWMRQTRSFNLSETVPAGAQRVNFRKTTLSNSDFDLATRQTIRGNGAQTTDHEFTPDLQVGDIYSIFTVRGKRSLIRINEIVPGPDGLIRFDAVLER